MSGPSTEVIHCPNCKEEVPRTLYCLNCGYPLYKLEQQKIVETPVEEPVPEKHEPMEEVDMSIEIEQPEPVVTIDKPEPEPEPQPEMESEPEEEADMSAELDEPEPMVTIEEPEHEPMEEVDMNTEIEQPEPEPMEEVDVSVEIEQQEPVVTIDEPEPEPEPQPEMESEPEEEIEEVIEYEKPEEELDEEPSPELETNILMEEEPESEEEKPEPTEEMEEETYVEPEEELEEESELVVEPEEETEILTPEERGLYMMDEVKIEFAPDPITKEVMENLAKNITLKIRIVRLLRENQVKEETFKKLFDSYVEQGRLWVSRRDEIIRRYKADIDRMEQELATTRKDFELLEIRKNIGDAGEDEYNVKAPAYKWDIESLDKEIKNAKAGIQYVLNLRSLIPESEVEELIAMAESDYSELDMDGVTNDTIARMKETLAESLNSIQN